VQPQRPAKSPYYVKGWGTPVFNEDFNDPSLAQWNIHDNEYANHDWSTVKKENVTVRNGKIILNTKRLDQAVNDEKNEKKRWYSAGFIDTLGKFSQAYGRFEMRAKLPTIKNKSRGIWPAFWLRADNPSNGGEIDILEAYGTPDAVNGFDPAGRSQGTLHYTQDGENWTMTSKFTPKRIDLNDGEFHTWTLEWTPEKITFLVDGQAYHTVKKTDDPRWKKAFGSGDPYSIRLNVQVGSKYWGTPNPTDTADRTDYVVDYVRVWKYRG
jgi:putative licheninase